MHVSVCYACECVYTHVCVRKMQSANPKGGLAWESVFVWTQVKKCRLSIVSVALDSAPCVTKWFASALLREEATANIYIYI